MISLVGTSTLMLWAKQPSSRGQVPTSNLRASDLRASEGSKGSTEGSSTYSSAAARGRSGKEWSATSWIIFRLFPPNRFTPWGSILEQKRLDMLVGSLCCVGRGFGRVGRGMWPCWARWAGLGVGFGWARWAGCAGLGWAWGLAVLGVLGWVGRGVWLLRFCVIVAEINVIVFCSLSTFRHQYEAFSIAINKKTKERPIMNSKSLRAQLYTVTVSLVFFWCLLDFFLLLRKHAAARGAGQTINAQLHLNSWKKHTCHKHLSLWHPSLAPWWFSPIL